MSSFLALICYFESCLFDENKKKPVINGVEYILPKYRDFFIHSQIKLSIKSEGLVCFENLFQGLTERSTYFS